MSVAEPLKKTDVRPAPLAEDLALVLARVRFYAEQRALWLHYLQQQSATKQARAASADSERNTTKDKTTKDNEPFYADDPQSENQWQSNLGNSLRQEMADIEQALQRVENSRLAQLVKLFGLTREDCDLLHTCIAVGLEPNLESSLGFLQGYSVRNYITDYLIARLYTYGHYFPISSESALLRWGLVQECYLAPGEPRRWQIDPQILRWLLGCQDLHPNLVGVAELQQALPPLDHWPVADTVAFFNRTLQEGQSPSAMVQIGGARGSGKRTFAAGVSAQLGLPLLVINANAVDVGQLADTFLWAQRQAFLDSCALAWVGKQTAVVRAKIALFPVQFIIGDNRLLNHNTTDSVVQRIELEKINAEERESLWRRFIPQIQTWTADEFATLARRQVHIGDIVSISQQGVNDFAGINQLVSSKQRDHLEGLAQRVACPFKRSDLIVKHSLAAALNDFLFEAKERDRFWQDTDVARLFPRGKGLVGLLSGPPGTGKTMAAQIIAAELGLDLFRIDLASVISKYVGETSQNLAKVIHRAAQMDIVLLFDEADALFSKRTEVKDAHDRFANTDTNYLLQAIENFPGIAILATNKKGNLDSAFIRRLRFLLEFNAPEYEQRLSLWTQLVSDLAGEEKARDLSTVLEKLAKQLTITGAQIKFSILSALFISRRLRQPLNIDHLVQGVNRELEKEGRHLSEQESNVLLRVQGGQ